MAQNVEWQNKTCNRRKKPSYRKCLQNKTVEHFTEHRKQAIVWKKTWKQWRDNQENCV